MQQDCDAYVSSREALEFQERMELFNGPGSCDRLAIGGEGCTGCDQGAEGFGVQALVPSLLSVLASLPR